ncbi:MAG TPA: hypothetical protein VII84_05450 [Acidimicrobiales bacterium]
MRVLSRLKTVGRTSVTALVVAAIVFAIASKATGSNAHQHDRPLPGVNFTITNTISDSSIIQRVALLYPGAPRFLWYTVHNSLKVPITVSTLSISAVTAPTGCPVSNLDYGHSTFTGSLVVPALGTNTVPVPISLIETHLNQNRCKGTTFLFKFSGAAAYTQVYATSTKVTSSHNPSFVGQTVTYTATVTASASASQSPVPSSPTGTVTFKDGLMTLCAGVSLVSAGTSTSMASCTPPAYLVAATHPITAFYVNTDGNFSNSSSSILYQVVIGLPSNCRDHYDHSIFADAGSPAISAPGGNNFFHIFGGNFKVHGSGGNDCFDGGDGDNDFNDGNGHDVAHAGNGNNVVWFGNGDDTVNFGNGDNHVTLGNGNDSVTIGSGTNNVVHLGNGSDSVTLGGASHSNVIGMGNDTIYLGTGSFNNFTGAAHHASVCHLPAPPTSWHGTAVAYYHDTVTNCTVVSP